MTPSSINSSLSEMGSFTVPPNDLVHSIASTQAFFTADNSSLPQLPVLSPIHLKTWEACDKKEKIAWVMFDLFNQWENSRNFFPTKQEGSQKNNEEIAQEKLKKLQHYFFNELDNDLADKWITGWSILPDQKARDITQLGLVNLAIGAYLDKDSEASYAALISYGSSLLDYDHTLLNSPSFIEKLRLHKLKKNLSRVNSEYIEPLKNNALQILKLILAYNHHPFPSTDVWATSQNFRSLDEAALLWAQLHNKKLIADIATGAPEDTSAVTNIRRYYLDALNLSLQKQQVIEQLFQSNTNTTNSSNTSIYFDGFTFRNAKGLSFDDLLKRPELEIPAYQNLTAEQKRSYLQEAFQQMGESTQYQIGSLEHSLASCLIRLFDYQHHRVPPQFTDEQQLIYLFKQAEEEWLLTKNYPLNPRILVALHLAHSNNIAIPGENWRQKVKFLLNNLADAFNHTLDSVPVRQLQVFNPREAAKEVLKKHGMTEREINKKRPAYKLIVLNSQATQENILSTISDVPLHSDNAIDEFLKKANANKNNTVKNLMKVKGKFIEPCEELEKKETAFARRLLDWFKEKAQASLKSQGIEITPALLEQEEARIVAQYKAATEDPQQWKSSTSSWIYWIPVIGSLKTIDDGIENKDWKTVLLGVAFLTLDAWSLGLADNLAKAISLTMARITARETITANVLRNSLKTFDLSLGDLPKTSAININHNSFITPENYKKLVQEVSQGSRETLWHTENGEDYLLVYLEDEDRIVPLKNQGGYYREVSWETGKVDLKKPLIYKDSKTGRYFATALKGGGLLDDFLVEAIPKKELERSPTVKEALHVLSGATDFSIYPDFIQKFHRYFRVVGQSTSMQANLKTSIENFCHNLYRSSITFRRLFNKYAEFIDPEENPWRIEIRKNRGCHTNLETKVIYLDPDIETSDARYLSTNYLTEANYEGDSFQLKESIIHELVHALTEMDDFQSVKPFLRKLIDQSNRGGVVFITDKILFEAFGPSPERVVYRAFVKGQNLPNRKNLIVRLAQENDLLDKQLDANIPFNAYKNILDKAWPERLPALEEMQKVNSILAERHSVSFDTDQFPEFFLSHFTSEDDQLLDELVVFFGTLYEQSKTFKHLFNRHIKTSPAKLTEFREIKYDARAVLIPPKEGALHIINDGTWYLSDMGPVPIERRRRFLYAILEFFLDVKLGDVPLEEQLTRRGVIVQIADKIFGEAGMEDDFPKRLAAANILPNENETLKQLLKNWPKLSRLAKIEDHLLEEAYTKSPLCFLIPCTSRIRMDKRIVKDQMNESALFNVEETMQEIKKEGSRIMQQIETLKAEKNRPNITENTHFSSRKLGFFKKTTAALFAALAMVNNTAETTPK